MIKKSFDEYVIELEKMMYKVARKYASKRFPMSELLTECKYALWHYLPKYNPELSSPAYYFGRCFQSAILGHFKKFGYPINLHRNRPEVETVKKAFENREHLDNIVTEDETQEETIFDCLTRVLDPETASIMKRFYNGESFKEINPEDRGQLSMMVHRAKKKLQKNSDKFLDFLKH